MQSKLLKKSLRLIGCLLLLACCLAGLATPVSAAPVAFRVGFLPIASPTGAIFEAMKRDRLLRQGLQGQNIRLSLIQFKKGGDAIAAFRRGELDAIAMGDLPMIEFALSTPIIVIGQLRRGYATLVAPRGSTPRDLKGRRVGTAFASTAHFALLKILQQAGLTEQDITLVPLDVDQMPDALLKGKIYAFTAWEPVPSLFITQHPDRFSSVGRQASSGYLSISRRFADQYPASVLLLAAGQARAIQWLTKDKANRQQAAVWNQTAIRDLAARTAPLSLEELNRQLAADLQALGGSAKLPPLKEQGQSLLADEFMFLKGLGKLPGTAQWETIRSSFDHRIMERIYRNPSASSLNRFEYDLK